MRSLIEFINHGLLPFVGRLAEVEKLVGFWRTTVESYGLRAALLLGEAGVGKSRLSDHVTNRIVEAGGVAPHIKIFPESSSSVLPLIARALYTGSSRALLKEEPEESLTGVCDALRRLSRLRATMLVIEDVHLLAGESLRGFSALLSALADETLSILCVARPVELAVRGVLDPYLTEEIALSGFDAGDIEGLWEQLFGGKPDVATVASLSEATFGNALALRSALRSAVKSGLIVQGAETERWYVSAPLPVFAGNLKRSAVVISEGMTASLSDQEVQYAESLASLGEVFAQEAAEHLIGADARSVLRALTFKGSIATTGFTPSPVTLAVSHAPLFAFTHSLLHRHFVERSIAEPKRIAELILSDKPLYSMLPYESLRTGASTLVTGLSQDERYNLLLKLLDSSRRLSSTQDWELAERICSIAEELFDAFRPTFGNDVLQRAECAVLHRGLWTKRRMLYTYIEEFRRDLDRFVECTAQPADMDVAEYRLNALGHLCAINVEMRELRNTCADEAEALFGRFPELYEQQGTVNYLRDAIYAAKEVMDDDNVVRHEAIVQQILHSDTVSETSRDKVRIIVLPQLMLFFRDKHELEQRMKLFDELDPLIADNREFMRTKISFYEFIGYTHRLLDLIRSVRPVFERHGFYATINSNVVAQQMIYALFGMPLDQCEQNIRAYIAALPTEYRGNISEKGVRELFNAALCLCKDSWGRELLEREGGYSGVMDEEAVVLRALMDEHPTDALAQVPQSTMERSIVRRSVGFFCNPESISLDDVVEELRSVLRQSVIRVNQLKDQRLALELVRLIGAAHPDIRTELQEDIRNSISEIFNWMSDPDRQHAGAIAAWLDRYGEWLTEEAKAHWSDVALKMPTRWQAEAETEDKTEEESRQRIRITMIGTVTIGIGTGAATRMKGARVCALLGTMVANQMLKQPLDPVEFNRTATGEDDPDHARKILKVALFRSREATAPEAILGDRDTPRLNPDLVHVDLLEAWEHLRTAESALASDMLMKAIPSLHEALDIVGNEVAFPSLYDSFFEAMRDDIETRLRGVVVRAAEELVEGGDGAAAEDLLRKGLRTIPEDEEMQEVLHQAFLMQGKHAEAERLRGVISDF